MNEDNKNSLYIDLSGRLPYGVKVSVTLIDSQGNVGRIDTELKPAHMSYLYSVGEPNCHWKDVNPYLRPMSSMTENEKDEFLHFFPFCRGDMYFDVKNECVEVFECPNEITLYPFWDNVRLIDWLNKKMFDYRGLIPKGLALEAPEGMYKS